MYCRGCGDGLVLVPPFASSTTRFRGKPSLCRSRALCLSPRPETRGPGMMSQFHLSAAAVGTKRERDAQLLSLPSRWPSECRTMEPYVAELGRVLGRRISQKKSLACRLSASGGCVQFKQCTCTAAPFLSWMSCLDPRLTKTDDVIPSDTELPPNSDVCRYRTQRLRGSNQVSLRPCRNTRRGRDQMSKGKKKAGRGSSLGCCER
jgi:hypothetical protein